MVWCVRVSIPCQIGGEGVEAFDAGLGDDEHVFDADASDGFAVKTGFDGDDIAFDEGWASNIEERGFVDIETDAVAGAVGHRAGGVRSALRWKTHSVAIGFDDLDCLCVDRIGGDTRPGRFLSGGLCFKNSRVHLGDFVGDVAVDDAAGAVAVVVGRVDVGEEIDDDGLTCIERPVSTVVAIGTDRTAGDDRAVGGRSAVFEEPDIDHPEHAFGGEWGSVVHELAVRVGGRIGDGLARHAHAALGDCLGVAQVVEFLGVFGASVEDAEVRVAVDGDPCFGDVVGIDRGEGAIDGDAFDAFLDQALGDGLGRFEFAVAGLPVR